MNIKTAQKQILKNWNKDGIPQTIEFLNDRFKNQLHGQIRDEFDKFFVKETDKSKDWRYCENFDYYGGLY
jgi:hypothetical protein